MTTPLAKDSSQDGKRPGFCGRLHAVVRRTNVATAFLLSCVCALLMSCGTAHYRKSADQEVYGIVQQVEAQVFGHTNAFGIDTAYSSRNPKEIPVGELIED